MGGRGGRDANDIAPLKITPSDTDTTSSDSQEVPPAMTSADLISQLTERLDAFAEKVTYQEDYIHTNTRSPLKKLVDAVSDSGGYHDDAESPKASLEVLSRIHGALIVIRQHLRSEPLQDATPDKINAFFKEAVDSFFKHELKLIEVADQSVKAWTSELYGTSPEEADAEGVAATILRGVNTPAYLHIAITQEHLDAQGRVLANFYDAAKADLLKD